MAKKGTRKKNRRNKRKAIQDTILGKQSFWVIIISICLIILVVSVVLQTMDIRKMTYKGIGNYNEDIGFLETDIVGEYFFKDEYGFWSYDDGEITSLRGIDVSEHQGYIDWQEVKNAGVDFAFIRVGYRTYNKGAISKDAWFTENIEGALANDIKVGIYFFSQAIDVDEAIEEAKFVVDNIQGYDVELPIAFDMEEVTRFNDRIARLKVEEITEITDAFCAIVENYGYESIVYTNPYWATYKLDLSQLTHRKIWLAHYTDMTDFPYRYDYWQYSEKGNVSGISTHVDLNIKFERK